MLTNKVDNKPIIQIDLEKWIPADSELCFLDMKDFLFKEMILKESEFRSAIEDMDWTPYQNKMTLVHLSNKAIIPQWSYMIIANKLQEVNSSCIFKTENYKEEALIHIIHTKDMSEFEGKRVLVKGCGKIPLSPRPFILLAQKLSSIVRSLAFGESCSSVPLFKN